MVPIRILHEDYIRRYCGLPVCLVLQDGTRHTGVLSACGDGQIYLNGGEKLQSGSIPKAGISAKSAKLKKKKSKKSNNSNASKNKAVPFGPGYPYRSGEKPLAAVSALTQPARQGAVISAAYSPFGFGGNRLGFSPFRNGFGGFSPIPPNRNEFGYYGTALAVSLASLAFLFLLV